MKKHVILFSLILSSCATPSQLKSPPKGDMVPADYHPIIIGHRGASGERPEHTIASYERAIEQGADFIEPDLVSTKDGVLIARHENEISGTTDVAEKFPKLKKTKMIDGQSVTGWFSEDLTLKQIKTLRAKERLPFRDQSFNGQFEVPTFEEVLKLAQIKSKEKGRTIGVYPETKHPTYFRDLGLPLEPALLKSLAKFGLTEKTSPVFIQSFEVGNLKELRKQTQVPLVQLLDDADKTPYDFTKAGIKKTYADLAANLQDIAIYADAVGPYKRHILPVSADNHLMPPTDFVARAHSAGLKVHTWTLRKEKDFLHADYKNDFAKEFQDLFRLQIDGIFTDFPGIGVEARKLWKP